MQNVLSDTFLAKICSFPANLLYFRNLNNILNVMKINSICGNVHILLFALTIMADYNEYSPSHNFEPLAQYVCQHVNVSKLELFNLKNFPSETYRHGNTLMTRTTGQLYV